MNNQVLTQLLTAIKHERTGHDAQDMTNALYFFLVETLATLIQMALSVTHPECVAQ